MQHLEHPFPPLYDAQSRVLILGSFPSVKSREVSFFYGHPQNRFWRVLARLLDCDVPQTIDEKSALLHARHIALWDVIASCDIQGSSDSSIRGARANDLSPIFAAAPIRAVFCNGASAFSLYQKHLAEQTGFAAAQLPSTSPANAAWSLDRLTEAWRVILNYL